jgi:hypothetical protein
MQHKVHRRFVGHTLGYQGEGPGTEREASAGAANNLSGGKRNVTELECPGGRVVEIENRSDDECENGLAATLSDVPDADTSVLWTGDDMYSFGSDTMETGSMLGSINFFNIDGIKNGSNAVGTVVTKNSRTNCIVSSIVDNRSDWVNRGGRVEQPFNQAYGGPNSVKFAHSSTKHSSRLPDIGECVTAAMPAVRNRAGGIDYGRALNIKSTEINTSEKFEYEGGMRYIYNKTKREQYGKIIETGSQNSAEGRGRNHPGY